MISPFVLRLRESDLKLFNSTPICFSHHRVFEFTERTLHYPSVGDTSEDIEKYTHNFDEKDSITFNFRGKPDAARINNCFGVEAFIPFKEKVTHATCLGKMILFGCTTGELLLSLDSRHNKVLQGHIDQIVELAISADGCYFASRSIDGAILVWKRSEDNKILLHRRILKTPYFSRK